MNFSHNMLLSYHISGTELSEYAVQVDEESEGMYGLVVHLKQRVRELEEQQKSVKSSQKIRSKCSAADDSYPDDLK